jgi:hypothetical protein
LATNTSEWSIAGAPLRAVASRVQFPAWITCVQFQAFSFKLSVSSYQSQAVSFKLSVSSYQFQAISIKLSASSLRLTQTMTMGKSGDYATAHT